MNQLTKYHLELNLARLNSLLNTIDPDKYPAIFMHTKSLRDKAKEDLNSKSYPPILSKFKKEDEYVIY